MAAWTRPGLGVAPEPATADPLAAPAPGSYALPVIAAATDAEVLLEDGRPERLRRLYREHITLLSFIYTRCTDATGCPLASAVLRQVLQRAEPALPLRLLSLSFDVQHDTPAIMHAYGEQFRRAGDPRWKFLSLRHPAALAGLLQHFGQSLQADPPAAGSAGYTHLLRVFLLDRRGRIRNIYGTGLLDADALLNDIRTLARSDQQNREAVTSAAADFDLLALTRRRPLGFPPLHLPANDPPTRAKIALGRKLFFDRRLSGNGTLSCANCHIPAQGFANNEMATAVGVEGRTVRRNAPGLIDVGYLQQLFHDGRETALETQVWSPLLARNEMAAPSVGWVVSKLQRLPDYPRQFRKAYGKAAGMETIGRALASYERALVGGASAFDRWHFGHDEQAINAAAKRGFALFSGKAGCAGCHTVGRDHALFTDQRYHVSGLAWKKAMQPGTDLPLQSVPGVPPETLAATLPMFAEPVANDLGRYEITFAPADRWAFRTPGLRNVALTAPYMHDGSLPTLAAVVAFYNMGGVAAAPQDRGLGPLHLSSAEQADLVYFLEALTGENVPALAADGTAAPVGDEETPE